MARRVSRAILWLRIIWGAAVVGSGVLPAGQCLGAEVETGRTLEQMTAEALLNVCRYVEWPEEVFVIKKSPIVFGVYGQTPIAREIEQQAKDWRANDRRILVRRFSWPATPNCNLLFIANSEKARLGPILEKVKHAPVLTVSEFEGCMARLNIQDGKPRFQFNMAAVTNAHLKLSAQLQKVADVNWVEKRAEAPKELKRDLPSKKKRVRMKNAE